MNEYEEDYDDEDEEGYSIYEIDLNRLQDGEDFSLPDFDDYRDEEQFVIDAVRIDNNNFQYASDRLRNDPEFVSDFLRRHELGVFEHIGSELYEDREFMLEATRIHSYCFREVPTEFKEDKEFVLEAVSQNGSLLELTSDELRDDPEVVMTAVNNYSWAIRYASNRLLDDEEFMFEPLHNVNPEILDFASDRLKEDREFISKLIFEGCCSIKHIADDLKADRELMLEAVQWATGKPLEHADESLKEDRDFMLEAVMHKVDSMEFAHEDLLNDKSFVEECLRVSRDPVALYHASSELQKDKEFVLDLCYQDERVIKHASYTLSNLCENKDPIETLKSAIELDRKGVKYEMHDDVNKILLAEKLKETLQRKNPERKPKSGLKI